MTGLETRTRESRKPREVCGTAGFGGSTTPPIPTTHPEKVKYWSNSNGYSLQNITYGVLEIAQWKCPEDPMHVWKMPISEFCRRKLNCPFCAVKPVPVIKQLISKRPELAAEWDFTANLPLSPTTIAWNADRSVFWICKEDSEHRWRSNLRARAARGERCPFCEAKDLPLSESLDTHSPAISKLWDAAAKSNYGLSPRTIRASSTVVITWYCPRGHRDLLSVQTKLEIGEKCRVCVRTSGPRELQTLASKYPQIAKQWDAEKNPNFTADEVRAGSSLTAWWLCERGHSWNCPISQRTASDSGCPFCSGAALSEERSLAVVCPQIAMEWHSGRNAPLKPTDVFPTTDLRVWWSCNVEADHVWEASIRERTAALTGCPFCAGQKVCSSNSLFTMYPGLASQWHPTRNSLTPSDIYAFSTIKVWWRCHLFSEHEWEAAPGVRVREGTGCPQCLWVCNDPRNSLPACHPELLPEWHTERNDPIRPEHINRSSSKKVWWKCSLDSQHEWEATVTNRAYHKSGCPACAGRMVTEKNCLQSTHPNLAEEWDMERNSPLTPTEITFGSHKRVHWICARNEYHRWQTTPNQRTSNSTGCPHCANNW